MPGVLGKVSCLTLLSPSFFSKSVFEIGPQELMDLAWIFSFEHNKGGPRSLDRCNLSKIGEDFVWRITTLADKDISHEIVCKALYDS